MPSVIRFLYPYNITPLEANKVKGTSTTMEILYFSAAALYLINYLEWGVVFPPQYMKGTTHVTFWQHGRG
jgi:hypothetical protein